MLLHSLKQTHTDRYLKEDSVTSSMRGYTEIRTLQLGLEQQRSFDRTSAVHRGAFTFQQSFFEQLQVLRNGYGGLAAVVPQFQLVRISVIEEEGIPEDAVRSGSRLAAHRPWGFDCRMTLLTA